MARPTAQFTTLEGGFVGVRPSTVDRLASELHGMVLREGDEGYRESRTIWNAAIDRKPSLIVQAADTHDVVRAVRFAGENGILLSVRGGGHNHVGFAVCDGGITIDMTAMRRGSVDPGSKIATVETGMTFADYDALTHYHGLASTGPIVSSVGLPGYLLGGGIGWLHRKAGAGCDSIVSAQLVTAAGDVVEVDEERHPDLLWALRGGGGNFGVVTRLGMKLHPVKDVFAGLIFHSLEDMPKVAGFVDGFMDEAPNDLNVWMLHRKAPHSPALPESLHGRGVIALGVTYAGPLHGAEHAVEPLRTFHEPLLDLVRIQPYPEWQKALDSAWGEGLHNEWVGHYLDTYGADAIATLQRFVADVPSSHTDVKLARLGGAISAIGEDDTALSFRNSRYAFVIQARWDDEARTDEQMDWTRRFHAAMAKHGNGKVYSNFIGHEPEQRVRDAYNSGTFARLQRLKSTYDPNNLFRMNVNIEPTV